MIHPHLFNQISSDKVIHSGVIGTGHFATAIITQAQSMRRLQVSAVADLDVSAAKQAFRLAGVSDEGVRVCESRCAAQQALERGQRVIVQDPLLLMELAVDVIVESTGQPEAGARHALAAIDQGKHVIMVNKETDTAIGPILNRLATNADVVYTQVDGDQHGLLIALVQWARELGLEVLCAGKARDSEFIHDPTKRTVACDKQTVHLSDENARWLMPIEPGRAAEFVAARRQCLQELPQIAGFDVSEMVIVANATSLSPDVEALHCPALRTVELPEVLCSAEEGGILSRVGVIDAVTSLHSPVEAGLGGGVFIVVACVNDYSRHILATKGCLTNQRGTAALIYRPYHLCGVETPVTMLCAGLLGVSTGAAKDYAPHFDIIARSRRHLRAGQLFGDDHSPELQALIRPAASVQGKAPLPFHMGRGNPFTVDVPAGTIITAEMVKPLVDSVLWQLRRQQDELFL